MEGEIENRTEIEGTAGRMMMGMDRNGHKRFLRCDEDGFLLVRAVATEEKQLEVED